MPPGSRALALVLILIATAAVLLLASGGSEAADIEHMDDWVISSGTVLVSDKTIDVHGNVTVQGGAVLKLYNCTLDILCVVNGQYSMEVQADGRLEAYGSTITGSDGYVDFWFRDDVVLEGCQLSRANGVQSGGSIRGIMVVGGPVTMTDTVISDCRYQGIYAQADLNLDNVTVQDVDQSNVYMTNWGASAGDIAISIRDCTFHGSSAGGWWGAGVYFGRWGGDPDLDLTLLSTTFLGGARGVYISGGSNSDVVVDDCEFHECEVGVAFSTQTTSGDYSISNNIVDGNDLADSVGFSLTIADGFVPTLVNNVVQRVTTAYSITGPWTGSATESLGNLTVSNCSRGVVTDRSVSLTVHNSSFAQMTSGLECFVADGGSTITIRDTVHPWGSGTVLNSNSWIRAHIDIGIRGARWKDGDAIAEGELVLENITQYEVARFNLSAVRSQDMIGWEVTNTDRRTSIYLYPAMYIEGHGFRGDRIDLRTYTPSIVEIVDDYVPSLDISSPPDGRGFNVTTVLCDGPFDELGSGLDLIEYSFDGGAYMPLTTWSGSRWNLALTSLNDGDHTLSLRCKDKVGNQGEEVSVGFLVDTVFPEILLDPYDHLVNTTNTTVTGTTEPLSTVRAGGEMVELDPDGAFAILMELKEGMNVFHLMVVDRAGNAQGDVITIISDTIAPDVAMVSPDDDIWTKARSVTVEGTADGDVVLKVNGEEVDVVNGSYRKRLDLVEGDFTITVTATDPAGNVAEKARTIHVDWTAPVLDIVAPEAPEVYVRESSIYISGDVDDPTIDHVMVNDQSIPLTSGRFVKQFTVLEGITEFLITVTDAADNYATAKVVVIRDLTPPTYESEITAMGGELVYVEGHLFSTAPAVEVHLTIDEVSIITLGDGSELPIGTEVRQRFELSEGVNEIDIYIKDEAGNQAQTYSQRVTVDTSAPTIDVRSPLPGTRTKEDTVTIHGFTEEGCTLTLNGDTVNVLSGGEFRHIVALVDGRNEFTLEVEDAMGNEATTSLSVLRDSDVTTGDPDTTGATITGFVIGLVVGIVLMFAFIFVRGRGEGPDREPPAGPSPPEPAEPFHAQQGTQQGANDDGAGGWEEY